MCDPGPGVVLVTCRYCGRVIGSRDDAPRHGCRLEQGVCAECAEREERALAQKTLDRRL